MKGIVWGLNRPTCDGRLNKLITEYELFWNIKPKKLDNLNKHMRLNLKMVISGWL